ncbi:heptaprenyl diphosphate synthase [Clostridia bacterium]|nr:heptaprenyl diphosphate synthase [Clostridia bacterium]
MHTSNANKVAKIAIFVALGVVLQIADSAILLPINIPGGKLGLANIINIYSLISFSPAISLSIAIIRAIIGGLLFGGIMSAMYSMIGAVLSMLVMIVLYKKFYGKLSFIGIGILGAATHNLGQVTLAAILLGSGAVYAYLPVLLIIGTISGSLVGYIGERFTNAKDNSSIGVA